jgi:uncharacterized membrane protein YhaH (DUF805 family)
LFLARCYASTFLTALAGRCFKHIAALSPRECEAWGEHVVSFLFSYKGRINRAQYWLGSLGVGVGGIVLLFVLTMLMPTNQFDKTGAGALRAVSQFAVVFVPIWALMGWCGLALQVKRFHDRGRSGLWTLLPLLPMSLLMVTLVNGVIAGQHPMQIATAIQPYLLLLWAVNIGFFIDLGCLPGKPGPNKYGDPPGSGRTSVAPTPPPRAPEAAAPTSAMSSLFGAQSAMERAIAEQARAQVAPRPAVATAAAAPAGGAPSFGRRTR